MNLPVSEAVRDRPRLRPALDVRAEPPDSSGVIATSGAESDKPARVPRRFESLYGLLCSLAVHLVLIVILACLVLENSVSSTGTLSGILGDADVDAPADFLLDAGVLLDAGGSEEPLELFSQPPSLQELGGITAPNGNILRGGSGTGEGVGDGNGDGLNVGVPAINVPGHAITKGSFSAWTVPEDPKPFETYVIMIQVRLPDKLLKNGKYRPRDITGWVIGTDAYKQAIKFPTNQVVDVKDGTVNLEIVVPGARQLVRDTIRIESKLLREKQVIQLVF